jgi:prepilin-type N-terminal cleavage/methylation domain-containing protein
VSANPNRDRQKGFSLPEVLIAAVIAAGVMAATAHSLGGSARLTRATADRSEVLLQGQTIAARIRAGMSDEEALKGFDDWRIERAPVPRESGRGEPFFNKVTITRTRGPAFSFEILAPTTKAAA